MMRAIAMVFAAAAALGLAACETATPYQPFTPGAAVYGGFTDQKLDDTHVRITFQGNDATSREVVNNYLLYRAAELTVSQGFDWFEMVDKHTHDHVQVWGDGPYGYWAPYWRVHGRWGWGGYWGGPYWGGPYWGGYDVQQIDEYQAVADIGMGHDPKPANDPRAFDARAVIQSLGPQIVRPK